ncbi:Glycosyl transferase family 2 [Desulfacinum infernum DSM 9756]|uniref:Glycosyl transferase family 2 n=1 Tax=Desulfacinum infernum DSM 9756 TaxID=1121391 RepID=A0A1M5HWX8_9BACT|nr:glycosyltransferase [Desulfacinum infernum]SHG20413.1 Glycosyl transferase family 2 [Desulfacinum infernum DSM 9756]
MKQPEIAVIVLNWNGKEDTLECLDSLSRVNYPRCRLIVVDNASSDGSVEAIRQAFPEVVILRNSRNLGYAGGNNVGIRYALKIGCEYLCILNNDTIVTRVSE